jgi:hypothetical protein
MVFDEGEGEGEGEGGHLFKMATIYTLLLVLWTHLQLDEKTYTLEESRRLLDRRCS